MATGHFSQIDFGFLPMKGFSEPCDDAKPCKKYKLLMSLCDFVLPLLMNGQVKVGLSHGAG